MNKLVYTQTEEGPEGATLPLNVNAEEHQVTIEALGVVGDGLATIGVKAVGASTYTLLRDNTDAVLSLDLTAGPYTIRFNGRFTHLQVSSEDFDGTSLKVSALGW